MTFQDATATMESIKNSQTVQTFTNGPVAEKARAEATNTKNEFSNLASARAPPSTTAATGQPLTHYHSFFYNLLSWENPRATSLSYLAIVSLIVATRYVPVVRLGLKGLYIVLGIMAAAEASGKLLFDQGFASTLRPKKYYTIPRETLESMIEDAVELLNFFVIEFQRIIFAENIFVTIGAFTTILITYFLIKVTPAWGMALLFTTVTYFAPLVYVSNREFIDNHLNTASDVVAAQTQQVRDLASQHTSKAAELTQSTLRDYSARASEMMGQAKKAAVEKGYVSQETAGKVPTETSAPVNKDAFPEAPTVEPTPASAAAAGHEVPLAS